MKIEGVVFWENLSLYLGTDEYSQCYILSQILYIYAILSVTLANVEPRWPSVPYYWGTILTNSTNLISGSMKIYGILFYKYSSKINIVAHLKIWSFFVSLRENTTEKDAGGNNDTFMTDATVNKIHSPPPPPPTRNTESTVRKTIRS